MFNTLLFLGLVQVRTPLAGLPPLHPEVEAHRVTKAALFLGIRE